MHESILKRRFSKGFFLYMLWNISANSDVWFAWLKKRGGPPDLQGVASAAAARETKSVGRHWAAGCGHCRRVLASPGRRPTARTHASLEKSATPKQASGVDTAPALGVSAICAVELFVRSRDHDPRLCRLQRRPAPSARRARRGRHR